MEPELSKEKLYDSVIEGHPYALFIVDKDLKAPVAIAGAYLFRVIDGKAGELTDRQIQYLTAAKKGNQLLLHDTKEGNGRSHTAFLS